MNNSCSFKSLSTIALLVLSVALSHCGDEASVVATAPEDTSVASDTAVDGLIQADTGQPAADVASGTDIAAGQDIATTPDTAPVGSDTAQTGDGGPDVTAAPPCAKNSDCASGYCKTETGTCADTCDPAKPCDDSDACSDQDVCKDGKCQGTPKSCDDQNACTTDTCDKKTGCGHANVDGKCDDASACTTDDACKDGKCDGKAADCDDKNPCTDDTCDKAKGCAHANNSGPCDDGNGCTLGDLCGGGACGGGKPKTCDDSNPCTKDGCDAVSGACAATSADVGCDDSNSCTENDQCADSSCKGAAVVCDDKNACTTDKCDPKTGCSYLDNNGLCDDGNACTDFDKCLTGKCKGAAKDLEECDDSNACTTDACDKLVGCVHKANTLACDDGDPCTPDDKCADSKCSGGASICPCKADADCAAKEDGNACNGTLYCDVAKPPYLCKVKVSTVVVCDTTGDGTCATTSCDQVTGTCTKVNEKDGQACDADGNVCTGNDACTGGACKAGASVTCDDANACTTDSCDPKAGCKYVANTSPCDADGTACTVGDQCGDKVCVAGKLKACNDNQQCTKDSCDAKTGNCAYDAAAVEGQSCDADGSNCTPDDVCTAGNCAAGKNLDCDDKNGCTIDKCDPKGGCLHIANADPCDADGDLCTQNDGCDSKVCVAGPKKNCDDGDACTSDACDPKTAKCGNAVIMGCGGNCAKDLDCDDSNPCTDSTCVNTKCVHKTNAAPCDDASKCTTSDGCAGGKCTGSAVKCDDGILCTDDSCEAKLGCVATNNSAPCNDFDLCTVGEACSGGKCGAGKPKQCDDGDICTKDTCNPADGGCKFTGINGCGIYCAKASDCDDKNTCSDESCQGGKCVSVNNTIACDDSNPCTAPDVCGSGKCNSGAVKTCNDNNTCTDDSCDKTSGACVNLSVAATTLCNDNNACTANDACGGTNALGKASCAGSAKNCDDGNACTTDTCNPASAGCANTANTGAACDDANPCSVGDTCNAGNCAAGAKLWVDNFAGSTVGFADAKGASAQFNFPYGVAADASGNLYVADSSNNRIRKIAPDGVTTTLAGNANPGLADAKGATAQFNQPYGLAIDAKGDLIVADTLNGTIRKVTAGGDTTSLAGAGLLGFQDGNGAIARFNRPHGVAIGPGGVILVADTYNHRIRRLTDKGVVTTLAGDGVGAYKDGPGKSAQFQYPAGLVIDNNGDAFVADQYNHRIRKVAKDGMVTTVAGSGVAGLLDGDIAVARFQYPWGIAILPNGSLLVADRYNMRLRRIVGTTVSTWAGTPNAGAADGQALVATFQYPASLTVDSSGYVYVADGHNHRIRRVRDATSYCAVSGKCYVASALNPQNGCQTCQPSVAADKFTPLVDGAGCTDGDLCTAGDACTKGSCGAGAPLGCDDKDACTSDACDAGTGACVSTVIIGCGGNCSANADCDDKNTCTTDSCVTGKCQNANNNTACDDGNVCTYSDSCLNGKCLSGSVIWTSSLAGQVVGNKDGKGAAAQFNHPSGIAKHSDGNLYVTDWSNHNVRKVAPDGTVTTLAGSGQGGFADGTGANAYFNTPLTAEVAPDGTLYVSDWSNSRVRAIDVTSGEVKTLAGGPAGYIDGSVAVARFNGVAATATTAGGVVYVVDGNNCRIRKIQLGIVSTLAGSACGFADGLGAKAQFNTPRGLALDTAGNLYLADHNNQRIRKITADGEVTTVSGNGSAGYLDGNADVAAFNNPYSVAWDLSGTLTVLDRGNFRIRRISSSGVVSTLAGNGNSGGTDGNAALTTFASSTQLTVDLNGNVWVADWDSARVRKVVDATKPCNIGGACYATGTVDAKNECQSCAAAKNATGWTGRADGAECSDGQYCTTSDACSGGTCGGTANGCDDKDACTTDACDKTTGGCSHSKIVGCNGYCTANSQCDDKSACTTDACTANACTFTNNTAACDDGNACSTGDVCSGGKCLPGIDVNTVTVAGSGVQAYTDATGTSAAFNFPYGIEVAPDGSAYVADTGNHRIRKILPDTTVITFAGSGKAGFADATGVQAWFNAPSDIAIGPNGALYVADRNNNAIRVIASDGAVTALAGNGVAGFIDDVGAKARFNSPYSLTVTAGGIVYVADYGNHRIRKILPNGKVTTLAGGANGYADGVGGKAQFSYPIGIGLDGQGNLIVADYYNHRIRKVTPAGVTTTVAGSGIAGLLDGDLANARFQYPWGIAVDGGGAIYVADRYNHRLRKILGTEVNTFAGSGIAGFLDGPAPQARFHYPDNLALDSKGWLWIADGHNHRIRKTRDTALSCALTSGCYTNGFANPAAACQFCDGGKAPTKWSAKLDAAACNDGELCTVSDACASGNCAGAKNGCDDADKCTADSCEAGSGACLYAAIPNCP